MEMLAQQFRTPEIYGDYWFNSDPIPLGALRGHAILIDFWDYACQRCLRTFPYLKEWYLRYREMGLVMVGIHTPQFSFETDPMAVRASIEKLGIRHPVMMDNDFIAWNAFRATVWPTKYLIDKHGFIRFVHAGEGSYQNFERAMQSLIADAGYRNEFPLVMEPVRDADRPGVLCYRATPEILAGWQRGSIGNVEGISPESTVHYEDPGIYLAGRLYLHGDWLNDRNYLRLDPSEETGGYLTIVYQGKEVGAVIKPEGERNFQVFVRQDDADLKPEDAGEDILIDEAGRSYIIVKDAKLYHIVRNREFGEHKLKMSTRAGGFALYGMSFTSCVIAEAVPNI